VTSSGCTEKTVRNTLHRNGIPLPTAARTAAIDLVTVFDRYQARVPVTTIAADLDVSPAWSRNRLTEHAVERDGPAVDKRRRSRFLNSTTPSGCVDASRRLGSLVSLATSAPT
jgi:hypothetical protein